MSVLTIDGVTPQHGAVSVTTAGTRVPLSAASVKLTSQTWIRANAGNTGVIYVGGATVSSSNGYVLAKGEVVRLPIRDLSGAYIDAATSGDGVTYLAT